MSEPIYSDDILAVEKLRHKLRKLKDNQERMKAINAAWRKAGKPKADNIEGWAAVAATLGVEAEALAKTRINMAHDFMDRAPYTYHIQNNNGNMKRIKDRIVTLVREREAEAKEARDKLTPAGRKVADGLVDAFFQSDHTSVDDEEEPRSEWFPPPNANG